MKLIENTKELKKFCKEMEKQPFVTVDFEFLREKTYYAKLCLIQVGTVGDAAIIDPLAEEIDLSLFWELMQNKKVLKVFHSGRQDIEIVHNITGKIPTPIFDTQVAAMVCGFGEAASYESLVKKILRKNIDKAYRLSNWGKRPLDEKQLEYAISDVTHLVKIYQYLRELLAKSGRENWVDEEMDVLTSPKTYEAHPYEAWHRIKHRSHNAKFLTMLKELAAWRDKRAADKNTIRQSIIKDEALLNIAAIAPDNLEQLEQIRTMRKDIVNGKLAVEILDVVKEAKKIKPEDYVKIEKEETNPKFSPALFELLKMLLRIISTEEGVVAKLIATDDDLREFASFEDEDNQMLKGWRMEIFGKDAIELRDGKISLSYDVKKKKVVVRYG